ncbi:MAG TPA: CPBP family intramembrane glutamic endopeptidase [Methylomirabilota bacterium]|jgi:membrane protease YdiL (CAAX protease family)
MRARGLVVWLCVSAVFLALDAVGVADGLALPVPLIVALVVARALEQSERARRHPRWLALGAAAGFVLLAFVTWRLRLQWFDLTPLEFTITALVAGALIAVLAFERPRVLLLTPLGLDPARLVHAVVAVTLALGALTAMLLFVALKDEPATTIPFYATDSVISVVSDVALALAGVGFLITRDLRTALDRLDLRPIRLRQAGWAVAAALIFHVAVGAMEWTESIVLPGLHALEERFDYEFIGISPLVGAALVSVAAGIGEEILFRGALQPHVGIVITASLFAMLHVQYQVPGIAMILVVGLALGLLKQWTSTTFTVVVHVVYDLGAFLLDFYG